MYLKTNLFFVKVDKVANFFFETTIAHNSRFYTAFLTIYFLLVKKFFYLIKRRKKIVHTCVEFFFLSNNPLVE